MTTATDTYDVPPIITGTYYEAHPGRWGTVLRDTYHIKKRKGSFYMEVSGGAARARDLVTWLDAKEEARVAHVAARVRQNSAGEVA
jgi:hypothetical protein